MIFRLAAYSLFLILAIKLYPASPSFDCHPAAQIVKKTIGNGQGFLATAITEKSEVVQFFLNADTGEWTEIAIDDALSGCTITHGTDWQFALVFE